MTESFLYKLSIGVSLIGLTVLFLVSNFTELETTKIRNIQHSDDKDVRISGTVVEINKFDSVTVIRVAEESSIDTVSFSKVDVKVGDNVSITGQLRYYKNKPEIIIDKLRKIN